MLQIARETDRAGDPNKNPKTGFKKQIIPARVWGSRRITHFNVDDNDAVDDGDVDDDGEDKHILRTTRQDRHQQKAVAVSQNMTPKVTVRRNRQLLESVPTK